MAYSLLVGYDDIVGTWVHTRLKSRWTPARGTAIGVVDDKLRIVAGCTYTLWNGTNIMIDVAAEPMRRWCTRDMRWGLLAYPFNLLGCKRVTALVDQQNEHSIKFITKIGFAWETVMEDACPGGDIHVFKMTKPEFESRHLKPVILPNIIKAPA